MGRRTCREKRASAVQIPWWKLSSSFISVQTQQSASGRGPNKQPEALGSGETGGTCQRGELMPFTGFSSAGTDPGGRRKKTQPLGGVFRACSLPFREKGQAQPLFRVKARGLSEKVIEKEEKELSHRSSQ